MIILNEYTFKQISTEHGQNIEYYKDVLKLINRHKGKILDDYLPTDAEGIIRLVDSLYPWFFIIFKDNRFLGFFYCYDWKGDGEKYHSCFITAAATKEFYGQDTKNVLNLFCDYLYSKVGIVKIKALVNRENELCLRLLNECRFKKEGWLKGNTLRDGQLQDQLIYGKINNKYLNKYKRTDKK